MIGILGRSPLAILNCAVTSVHIMDQILQSSLLLPLAENHIPLQTKNNELAIWLRNRNILAQVMFLRL